MFVIFANYASELHSKSSTQKQNGLVKFLKAQKWESHLPASKNFNCTYLIYINLRSRSKY